MRCLIAVDGLSKVDLPLLLEYLPNSNKWIKHCLIVSLESPLGSSQAAWAEILTGKNCFMNGCAGYAHPISSLNTLSVFSEENLLEPAIFAQSEHQDQKSVTINVPLLRPKESDRIWLADGSLSTAKFVSPSNLQSEPIFASYEPRAYKSHAGARILPQRALIERCIEIELNRLSCAVALFKRGRYSKFLYRLSIFDQLCHLIGLNFLSANDLSVGADLRRFLADFDSALALFCSATFAKLAIVSCHSHVPCVDTVNLNLVLASGGFAEFIEHAQPADARVHRLRVAQALWQPTSHYLTTLEGRLDTGKTVAASPVSGCVYINKSTVFDDGIVSDLDYQQTRAKVLTYLHNYFSQRFPGRFAIEQHPADMNATVAPDLIVKIDGVEFENLVQSAVPVKPLTTHSPTGFALINSKVDSNNAMTSQLASLLHA